MNKISRKGFLKIAAAAAMSGVTAGALAACESASSAASRVGQLGCVQRRFFGRGLGGVWRDLHPRHL